MQKKKNQWESFLSQAGKGKYCYIMLYSDRQQYAQCFENKVESYSPGKFGEDYIVGINGPLNTEDFSDFLTSMDETLTYTNTAAI